MTNNDQSTNDHQDELSENIGDGGGCCEAWEVAESLRDSKSNRRSFMKTLGGATASAAGLGMVNPVSARDGWSNEIDNRDLDGAAEAAAIKEAVGSEDFQTVRDALAKNGATTELEGRNAFVVDHQGKGLEYTVVMVPFDAPGKDEAYVLWSDSPQTKTLGSYVEVAKEGSEAVYQTAKVEPNNGHAKITERSFAASDIANEISGRSIKTMNHENSDCPGGFPLCNINFSCVGTAAAKAGVLYGACSSCAGGFIPACFACAGSGILLVETDCCVCN